MSPSPDGDVTRGALPRRARKAREPTPDFSSERRAPRSVVSTANAMVRPASASSASSSSVWSIPRRGDVAAGDVPADDVGSPGLDVDGVAHVQEVFARPVDRAVRAVGEPRRGEGGEAHVVAHPAARLLEVRLDEVGELAEALGARARGGEQVGEALARGAAPVREDRGARLLGERLVAGDVPQVEQPGRGGEVLGGDLAAFGERPDGVVELEPGVPDRVPQALRERGERVLLDGGAVVEQHQVEVARGSRVAPADAADGRERDPLAEPVGDLGPVLAEAGENQVADRLPALPPRCAVAVERLREFAPLTLEVPHPGGVRDLSV